VLLYRDGVWTDIEYARQYGEEKLMSEFMEYEKLQEKIGETLY